MTSITDKKNIICVFFAFNQNNDLLRFLYEFREQYNIEVSVDKIDQINQLKDYGHKILCFYAEKEDDFVKLLKQHNKLIKEKGIKTILFSTFDCSGWMSEFGAESWIYTSDWKSAYRDFKQILDIILKGQIFGGKNTYAPQEIYNKAPMTS